MRRYVIYVMVILLLLMMVAPAAVGAGGPHPKATGEAWFMAGSVELYVHFNAHGTDPAKGEAYYENDLGHWFAGDVNCYYQSENEAAFGGMVYDGTYDLEYFLIEVQDNGKGGSGDPDKIRVRLFDSEPECELSGSFPGVRAEGNITVHGTK